MLLLLAPGAAPGQSDEDFFRANKELAVAAMFVHTVASRMRICAEIYPQRSNDWSAGLAISDRWDESVQKHFTDEPGKKFFQSLKERTATSAQESRAKGVYTQEFCNKHHANIMGGLPNEFTRKYAGQAGPVQPAAKSGYPEQSDIFTDPPFRRPDLETFARPASPEQVMNAYGPEFASLPRLGVVLVLVGNRRSAPFTVSRQSVRLTLPDGRVLKPLEPSEMAAWLQEVRGLELGKPAREVIFGRHSASSNREYEKGILTVPGGRDQGDIMNFRFPEGSRSGEFLVDYVLDLGADGQVPVKQKVQMNIKP